MAKSSGGMNFHINLNGVDKFLADAARSDDALKRILDTLDKISRGNNLQKYWADQYKSIEGLVDAFEKASKYLGNDGNVRWLPTVDAEELIKSINAFAAHSQKSFDEVASMMTERFGEGAQAVISKASEMANKLDSAFSINSMKDSFAALDEMRKASTESVEMLGRLDSASTKRLQQELHDARQELFETQSQLQEFQQIWDRIGSGGDVSGVLDQIDSLERRIQGIRDTAYNEFETFLNGNDISSNFGGAQKYFDQILNGSMTARQAIAEFKAEFNSMFEGGASGEMDAVYSMFTQIRDEISRIPGMLESVITSMHDMGAFSGEAEKTAESLQRVEERTTAIANSGANLQPMADAIANIASGIKETGDGSASTLASLQGIVEALGRLGNIDSGSLTNISMMLRSIASMNGFTASSKGLDTLVETLDKLSRFSNTSALVGLSSIDLSKLKVSKAALENLATYLPQIQGVDVSPLQKLANINWANLDGLKLTKTNLENVTNLIEKTGIKAETSGFADIQSAIDKIGTSLDGLQEKIRTTFDLSNAISQAGELASQYANVKAALDTAASAGAKMGAASADSAMAARVEKEAAALEKYKQQLDSLSQLNVTGKNAIQFAGNETSVEKYKAELAELQAKFDAIGVASESTRAQAVADFEAQRQEVEELRASLNQTAKAQTEANNLANKIELYASKNGAAPLEIRQQWQQWINELRSGDAVAQGVLNNIKSGFASTANQIKITNNGGKTFFQTLKEGWSKFGGWSIVTRSFTKVISLFKEAVTAVKDVDSAMTELKKVTNLTSVEYDRLYENATKMAGSVGSSLADTINAVADFSRVGFDIDMAQDLAEASLVYQNVADGLEGIEAATSSLISTIKAFGEETYTAMGIVDMFNEVNVTCLHI